MLTGDADTATALEWKKRNTVHFRAWGCCCWELAVASEECC